jgi:3-mercaptopyruvate sulfurtransferase SseA
VQNISNLALLTASLHKTLTTINPLFTHVELQLQGILEGGFAAWQAAGLPTVSHHPSAPLPTTFRAQVLENAIVDHSEIYDQVYANVDAQLHTADAAVDPSIADVKIVDARSRGRFCGEAR